jgi:hypothetical protein
MLPTLPSVSRRIGDCEYHTRLLSTSEGLPINVLLLRVLGPSLAELAGNATEGLADASWSAMAAAIKEVAVRLDTEDLQTLCKVFAATTIVHLPDGKKPAMADVFDAHFAGKYMRMYQWLAFCVEVNFADFFEVLQAKSPGLLKAAP